MKFIITLLLGASIGIGLWQEFGPPSPNLAKKEQEIVAITKELDELKSSSLELARATEMIVEDNERLMSEQEEKQAVTISAIKKEHERDRLNLIRGMELSDVIEAKKAKIRAAQAHIRSEISDMQKKLSEKLSAARRSNIRKSPRDIESLTEQTRRYIEKLTKQFDKLESEYQSL